MYTQCPDCEIAFKVTADVLKQAAGMVRCGGCGYAFNALAYLSEQMPRQATPQKANAPIPELRPEIIETDDGLPEAISAEQSAALLKTLDELAGSNIRIEDTGVEWRVLDDEDAAAPAADDDDFSFTDSDDLDLLEIVNVDEYLDDAETPIDEFLTATPEVVDAPEIFAAAASINPGAVVDELRFDDNTPLPDDFDLENEASFVSSPEMALQRDAVDDTHENSAKKEATDFALSEPDEWTDILGEFQELALDIAAPIDSLIDNNATDEEDFVEEDVVHEAPAVTKDAPLDMDTQFALQAEAMGIELSGVHEIEDVVDDFEKELADELGDEFDDEIADELEEELDAELEDDFDSESEFERTREVEFDEEIAQLELIDEQHGLIEEPVVAQHSIENELADVEAEDDAQDGPEDCGGDHYVAPMTEEEHTVNMLIDQDLMAFAVEDEDGFASTIVIPDKDAKKKARRGKTPKGEFDFGDDSDDTDEASGFETIIMEGDFVRFALDDAYPAEDTAAAKRVTLAPARDTEKPQRSGGARFGVIAGVVLLAIALGVQAMHQSREALATIPAFSNTVGQVYRALGQPVQPAWDITGWRIEASKDVMEREEGVENLTVYSRLGNKSNGPLPYPLISITLTDRFLEAIGNQILDPAEYLPTDLDPRKLVEPGNTFNAVISINSPSADAEGYKIDVCYRLSDGRLRCAIDDFK